MNVWRWWFVFFTFAQFRFISILFLRHSRRWLLSRNLLVSLIKPSHCITSIARRTIRFVTELQIAAFLNIRKRMRTWRRFAIPQLRRRICRPNISSRRLLRIAVSRARKERKRRSDSCLLERMKSLLSRLDWRRKKRPTKHYKLRISLPFLRVERICIAIWAELRPLSISMHLSFYHLMNLKFFRIIRVEDVEYSITLWESCRLLCIHSIFPLFSFSHFFSLATLLPNI